MPPNHSELIEQLSEMITQLEDHQTHPQQMGVVARRLGNIVLHMKELLRDLQPVSEQTAIAPPKADGQRLAPQEQETIVHRSIKRRLRP